MNVREKIAVIQSLNKTILCIGLDTDADRLPVGFSHDVSGMLDFNKAIIDATADLCCAYKINFAFYERHGSAGIQVITKTLEHIPSAHFSIADAKRGDIENTSGYYARAILSDMNFDAITVHPYMGVDSVEPFLNVENKLVFILALTSNRGSRDFQYLDVGGRPLYKVVMDTALQWKRQAEIGFVVGATHASELSDVRSLYPAVPLLIPGVGVQGADARNILKANAGGPAFVNASRSVLYASSASEFAEEARSVAHTLARELSC